MTGSSARKLKRGGANLLAGRAWEALLFPLCFPEIPNFLLLQYLNRGGLPSIYPSPHYEEDLHSYTNLYLREEIFAEALARRIDAFARFLDVVALTNGEELNFQGLASDCGVPARTLHNYLQVLEDTLIGFKLPAFLQTRQRKAISRAKFYLFDVGVANSLARRGEIKTKSELFGKCFEHFLIIEIRAYLNYQRWFLPLSYWRSTSGFEVDCIVGRRLALEFKSTDLVSERHLRGLKAFKEEGLIEKFAIVSMDEKPRRIGGIQIYPWREFLMSLWEGRII